MKTMRAMQVIEPGEPMRLVEIPIPEIQAEQVLISVETCGVCSGDSVAIEGRAPNYPIIPGHEVIGTICKKGSQVHNWQIGDRVGIGFHANYGKVHGTHLNGGYAEYMAADANRIVSIPQSLSSAEASPLMCAGETTFSGLRNSVAKAGDLVAIQGIGGLGHLAIQFAKKFGFETVAISRGKEKEALIRKLGADHYIDSAETDPSQGLQILGGAKVILCTSPSASAIAPLVRGLQRNGQLMLVSGSNEPLGISSAQLLAKQLSISGTFTAGKEEIERVLKFCDSNQVKPLVEIFSLEEANEAFAKMKQAKVKFRAVLQIK